MSRLNPFFLEKNRVEPAHPDYFSKIWVELHQPDLLWLTASGAQRLRG